MARLREEAQSQQARAKAILEEQLGIGNMGTSENGVGNGSQSRLMAHVMDGLGRGSRLYTSCSAHGESGTDLGNPPIYTHWIDTDMHVQGRSSSTQKHYTV